jgi:hypothetical protein
MNNNQHSLIEQLIFLPEHALSLSDTEALKQIGYFEGFDTISAADIEKVLSEFPEQVDAWLMFSENKRSSTGWYFKQIKDTMYHVGYLAKNTVDNLIETDNKIHACAIFIKHEIEEMRNYAQTPPHPRPR